MTKTEIKFTNLHFRDLFQVAVVAYAFNPSTLGAEAEGEGQRGRERDSEGQRGIGWSGLQIKFQASQGYIHSKNPEQELNESKLKNKKTDRDRQICGTHDLLAEAPRARCKQGGKWKCPRGLEVCEVAGLESAGQQEQERYHLSMESYGL